MSLVETLCWLVDIPSVTGNETAIRDAVASRLAQFQQREVANSVVVGQPGRGSLLLVGHLDTVPAQAEARARVIGDRVHGLGTTDMKSGLAVMIHLLEELGNQDLVAVFYAGEEGPMSGNDLGTILTKVPELVEAEAAFVMEPTNREVHGGCNGSVNATVWFDGEAAHSARPWLGVNAVTRAGRFLTFMDGLRPELHEIDGLRFKEVISVTGAEGGIAKNVIPSRFELNVNYRFSPDRSLDDAVARLHEVCSEADGIEINDRAPAAMPNLGHPLFQKLIEASGGRVSHKQGWTDVARLSAAGVAATNFGPGETSLAHKPEESVRISDLDWAFGSLKETLS